MPDSFSFNVTIDPKSLQKAAARLDKWKGAPLATRIQKATRAGMGLFVAPLKARASRHNLTGKTQCGYAVRTLRKRGTEVNALKVGSNTWYRHFAIVGTSRGVEPDPYVGEVHASFEPAVVGFIEEQIRRLE